MSDEDMSGGDMGGDEGGNVSIPEGFDGGDSGGSVGAEETNIWNFDDETGAPEVTEGDSVAAGAPAPAPAANVPGGAPVPNAPGAELAPVAQPAVPVIPQAAPAPAAPPRLPYDQWRANLVGDLQSKNYALSPQQAEALLTEPETVVPQLLANLHMAVLEQTAGLMQNMLPGLVERHAQFHTTEAKAVDLFSRVNPDLTDPKYKPIIMQVGRAYRQINATAPAEEAAKSIGLMVRSALGIAAQPQQRQAPQQQQQQRAAVARSAPFSPARGRPAAQAGASGNAFTDMAETWGDDF
jgi:hypothetical protein